MADSDPDPDPDGDLEAIRSIAVDPEAVVDAFVYTRENPGTAVLRVTPPFHGRMRARLHVFRDGSDPAGAHCRPAALLTEDAVAAYPSLANGEAGSDVEATDSGDCRPSHGRAIEDWRGRAEAAISEAAVLERGDDRVRVGVTVLG